MADGDLRPAKKKRFRPLPVVVPSQAEPMRWSQAFIPTLREVPGEAEVPSHQLLLRAGYIRQVAAGIYSHLFLAQKSLLKIAQIIREEMNRIGGQEFYLPALNPAELWKETGRWDTMGVMFKFKDRNEHDMCLGMTHEEEMTNIARGELRSYKQLPQIWYQIQEKFRDEPRPRSGLLRLRQFTMKDSYSFDLDDAGLDASFQKHVGAYARIFERCGLKFLYVEAYSGMMGGKMSSEYTAPTDSGEDSVVLCECGYAANLEKAESRVPPVDDPPGSQPPEPFPTPGQKTIEDLVRFTGESPARMIKTLVYIVQSEPVVILLRGDHALSETKLAMALGSDVFRPATPAEALSVHGANIGSLDSKGEEVPLVMGSYGVGLERILSAAAEQNHDEDGMYLPRSIAPFDVVLTVANMDDPQVRAAGEKLYEEARSNGVDVLFDDRAERPGVKFKDADLIGVPYRVTLGKHKFEKGLAEIFTRSTKQVEDAKLEDVVRILKAKYLC